MNQERGMHEGSRDSTASVELPSNMLFDCNLSVGCSPLLVLGKGSKKKSEKVWSFAKPGGEGFSEGGKKTKLLF